MARTCLLALLVVPASAFTTIQSSSYGAKLQSFVEQMDETTATDAEMRTQLGVIWHMPEDSEDATGLGGGIAWAWDPKLCDGLLPATKESVFGSSLISCEYLLNAFKRAVKQWTMNHRYINAYDVTKQCADIQGGADKVTADCPLIELWVTSASGNIEDSPMWRTTGDSEGSTTIALTDVSANYGTELITEGLRPPGHRFRHTNGVVSKYPAMIESYKATLQFGTGVCWYVDTSFCASFHDMKKTHGNEGAKTIMLAITWLLLGLAIVTMAYRLRDIARMIFCRNKLAKRLGLEDEHGNRLRHPSWVEDFSVEVAEWNSILVTLQFLGLFLPPIFYYEILLPCFNCYNFEAAAVHHMGHVLGLGHPNKVQNEVLPADANWEGNTPGANMFNALLANLTYFTGSIGFGSTYEEYSATPTTGTCRNPWEFAANGTPADASIDDLGCQELEGEAIPGCGGVRSSVMNYMNSMNPETCLQPDDLEGLHTLYPDCSYSSIKAICLSYTHNIGLQRVGIYIGGPLLLVLVLVKTMQSYVMYFREKQLAKDLEKLHRKEQSVATHRFKLAGAYAKEEARKQRMAAARAEMGLSPPKSKEENLRAFKANLGASRKAKAAQPGDEGGAGPPGGGDMGPAPFRPPSELNRL